MKTITDETGIKYKEVSYDEYLKSRNKHRIIKHLEAQYFVEIDDQEVAQSETREDEDGN